LARGVDKTRRLGDNIVSGNTPILLTN